VSEAIHFVDRLTRFVQFVLNKGSHRAFQALNSLLLLGGTGQCCKTKDCRILLSVNLGSVGPQRSELVR
jgi:hypothetical protein